MTSRRSSLALLGLAYLGFESLGLPDGLIGVAWPGIRAHFAMRQVALGELLIANTAGCVAASAASGWMLSRTGIGSLLARSCGATVAAGALLGLGAGAIDAGLNGWIALRHSARTVSLLHAFYGVGAAGGPLIMAAVPSAGDGWRSGHWIVAVAQIALASTFALARLARRASRLAARGPSHAGAARRFGRVLRLHRTRGRGGRVELVAARGGARYRHANRGARGHVLLGGARGRSGCHRCLGLVRSGARDPAHVARGNGFR